MANRVAEDQVLKEITNGGSASGSDQSLSQPHHHPYAFHVSGPRNVSSPNWRDLINSSWKDGNYKRTVIACFIQAVYLLELDRQENRDADTALAPKWWIPFKYKLSQTLIDERDGSIFGAILEWDRSAALADLVLIRPSGAPRAVLVLRGTLLKSPTFRRDVEDDLRFFAWESLKGSVRFKSALEALGAMAERFGSGNVCVAGHSLGAGLALQVGKALAKEGVFAETHLFNPPSVSLAMSLRNIGEKASFAWRRVKSMVAATASASNSVGIDNEKENSYGNGNGGASSSRLRSLLMSSLYGMKASNKWVPHLYVNNSDYICCSYNDPESATTTTSTTTQNQTTINNDKENVGPNPTSGQMAAKLFVMSKGNQRFMEAHGLEQWWSDDVELRLALHDSKLISRQLKSLHSLPSTTTTPTTTTI